MPGELYLVSTPIGNLEDISRRALGILSEVNVIACEDTRRTRVLLDHFGLATHMVSYHDHNERERAAELIAMIIEGKNVAIVSDAGTPGISDPGYRIVNAAIAADIKVIPVPGPAAFVSALVASGLPTDEFYFGGFLPPRGQARRAVFERVRNLGATLVFYETPHRIGQAIADAIEVLGDRRAVVARELTKMHEEVIRGTLVEIAERFSTAEGVRGEMVLIIDRSSLQSEEPGDSSESILTLVARLEGEGVDHRTALKRAARQLGLSRDEAYRRLIELKARANF